MNYNRYIREVARLEEVYKISLFIFYSSLIVLYNLIINMNYYKKNIIEIVN